MQKLLPILSLVFVLTATPVIASHGNDKNSSEENCDTDASWKNHGSYVSCVAHEHEGGAAVSAAAQSDIGKKSDNDEVETSPSPSVSPSPSPEVSPSPSPEVSPTPSVSPTPQASPTVTAIHLSENSENILAKIIEKLEELIGKLENLF